MDSIGTAAAQAFDLGTRLPDEATCYRALQGRDPRFDGWIYVGVTSTGIYCRPSCPARTPKAENCRWFAAAGAAQQSGFRACRRCRPDAVPGSPQWNQRRDVAGRAMRLIADGLVDREGVSGLARRLGYSERQLQRVMVAETGATALILARAQRAHAARLLIENSELAMSDIAFAAGFSSVRQFNETVQEVFELTPRQLREAHSRRHRHSRTDMAAPGTLQLRLPVREPFDGTSLLQFLGARTVAGLEAAQLDERTPSYSRTIRLPQGVAVAHLTPSMDQRRPGLHATVTLTDLRDLGPLVARLRRLADLDADPQAIDAHLATDPALSGSVRVFPGLRIPGTPDPTELAIRTVLGQQVSLAAGIQATSRLVAEHGEALAPDLVSDQLQRLFPTAATIAAVDPKTLAMPQSRARAVVALAQALAAGDLDLSPGADLPQARRQLLALPGVGIWTADQIAVRALGDSDVLMSSDLVIARELRRLGLDALDHLAPWRSYAAVHLLKGWSIRKDGPAHDRLEQEDPRAGRSGQGRRKAAARTQRKESA